MTVLRVGRVAEVTNGLPGSLSVSTTTGNTVSPIVVTTTVAHNINTNEVFVVAGVGGNTAANGTFIAGSVTSTTITLTTYPAGGATTGNGNYTSGGTVQSLGYGGAVSIPVDLSDMMQSGTVNVPFEALLDMTFWAAYSLRYAINILGGGSITLQSDAYLSGVSGSQLRGTFTADTTGPVTTFTGFSWVYDASSNIKLSGRKVLTRSRVALSDADHTVDVSQGDRFTLPNTTAGKRTITLKSTGTVPQDGEMLSFFCDPVGLTIASGIAFKFAREDASTVANVYWDTTNVPTQAGADNFWLTCEFTGGTWKLAENSASTSDVTNTFYVGVRLV